MLFASLPDPSSPGFPAMFSIVIGFAGTTYGFWRRLPRGEIQWVGFYGAYIGAGLGILIYSAVLISEL